MTVDQMRAALKLKYSGSRKFDKMKDDQIIAIYRRLQSKNKI